MLILKQGSQGSDVKRLQLLLNQNLKPSPKLNLDGCFGSGTHAAVINYQKQKGLSTDGIVGQQTWMNLQQLPLSQPLSVANILLQDNSKKLDWMIIACAELGVHELSTPGLDAQRIIDYHSTTSLKAKTDEVPWCSSFVNWVMETSGYSGTNNAMAKSWVDWGSGLVEPKYGAIIVIKKKGANNDAATGSSSGFHVAFFVEKTSTHIKLLGGNQGNKVKYSSFSLQNYDIKACRWP